jgi:hypothetical protein
MPIRTANEHEAAANLIRALGATRRARHRTGNGLADDLCHNAIEALKGALRYVTADLQDAEED